MKPQFRQRIQGLEHGSFRTSAAPIRLHGGRAEGGAKTPGTPIRAQRSQHTLIGQLTRRSEPMNWSKTDSAICGRRSRILCRKLTKKRGNSAKYRVSLTGRKNINTQDLSQT